MASSKKASKGRDPVAYPRLRKEAALIIISPKAYLPGRLDLRMAFRPESRSRGVASPDLAMRHSTMGRAIHLLYEAAVYSPR